VELIVQPGAQAEARSASLLEQVVQADPEDIPVKPCRRRNGLETGVQWSFCVAAILAAHVGSGSKPDM